MKKIFLILLVSLGLQTQAQVVPCDSVEYAITPTGNTTLQLDGAITGICPVTFPCIVTDWNWTICDDALCFSDTGQSTTWNQFTMNDTIKVCLTTILEMNNMIYTCLQCDTLIYDGFGGWMIMNMGNPTAIKEIKFNTSNDGKIYDLLGKELSYIPVGKMYIRNSRLYISK